MLVQHAKKAALIKEFGDIFLTEQIFCPVIILFLSQPRDKGNREAFFRTIDPIVRQHGNSSHTQRVLGGRSAVNLLIAGNPTGNFPDIAIQIGNTKLQRVGHGHSVSLA